MRRDGFAAQHELYRPDGNYPLDLYRSDCNRRGRRRPVPGLGQFVARRVAQPVADADAMAYRAATGRHRDYHGHRVGDAALTWVPWHRSFESKDRRLPEGVKPWWS